MIQLWRTRAAAPDRDVAPMPIVVGAPRSGTTMLRLMLDAHPALAIPPETGFLTLAPGLRGSGDRLRERFLDAVTRHGQPSPSWPDFEIPRDEFREALHATTPFTAAAGFRAFYRLYAARFGKPRWGDKTPLYCLHLAPIRRVLPEARFVHVIRDGRDVALSSRKMWFSPGFAIETQAAYWRRCVLGARRAGLGRPDYLEVRYEDLVLRTRETLARICAFVDLPYDEAMERFHTRAPDRLREHKGRSAPDGSAVLTQAQRLAQQERTTRPPDPSLVHAWQDAMSAEDRAGFRRVAGRLLDELGYPA
jgi:hypothetical protein